jgi:hypothetical protein
MQAFDSSGWRKTDTQPSEEAMPLANMLLPRRPHLPPQVGGCVRPRPRKEAVAAGQDGEERDAQHGAGFPGAHGGCRKIATPRRRLRHTLIGPIATTLHLGRGLRRRRV